MALIDEKQKPLRRLLRENDFDDLEFRLAPSMLEGSGEWRRKPRRFAFGEGLASDPVIERMRAAWRDGNLYETGGDALFETRAGIGGSEINGRIDVAKAETLLERAGAMDLKDLDGPTGIWGDDKAEAILRFQAGNGLKQDAVMQPGGETMGMLKAKLAAKPAVAESENISKFPQDLSGVRDKNDADNRIVIAQSKTKSRASVPSVGGQNAGPPPIFNPTGGTERNDPEGAGHFGAPRGGGTRRHKGVDITANPKDPVVAPIDGKIVLRGKAYRNDPRYDSVHIVGTGKYTGMTVKILYVDRGGPDGGLNPNFDVKAGITVIGGAQDISQKHGKKMKPHVHIEVLWRGKRVDPARALPIWP